MYSGGGNGGGYGYGSPFGGYGSPFGGYGGFNPYQGYSPFTRPMQMQGPMQGNDAFAAAFQPKQPPIAPGVPVDPAPGNVDPRGMTTNGGMPPVQPPGLPVDPVPGNVDYRGGKTTNAMLQGLY